MIALREQDIVELGSLISETGLCFPCQQGYQKIQLEAINELLSTNDFRIVLYCDFSNFCKNEKLIYNLDIITYLPNVKQLLVVNYGQPYLQIKSLDFLANTKSLVTTQV